MNAFQKVRAPARIFVRATVRLSYCGICWLAGGKSVDANIASFLRRPLRAQTDLRSPGDAPRKQVKQTFRPFLGWKRRRNRAIPSRGIYVVVVFFILRMCTRRRLQVSPRPCWFLNWFSSIATTPQVKQKPLLCNPRRGTVMTANYALRRTNGLLPKKSTLLPVCSYLFEFLACA